MTDEIARPDVPVTLSELANQKSEALENIHARILILETLRRAAIRATSPEDWVRFRTKDGVETAYLQDCGGQRVRDVFGIEITDVSEPVKLAGSSPGEYVYIIRGSGESRLTRQRVVDVEGGRSSIEDAFKDKSGPDQEYEVRKAARANLNGSITRELAGLKSVPVNDLDSAWTGTGKTSNRCPLGRGFGKREPRQNVTGLTVPICEVCQTPGELRPATDKRGAFYGCPNWKNHKDQKWIVPAELWDAKVQTSVEPPSTETANHDTQNS